ncbi:alpha/beta fold hydrolase [Paraburkholderia sp. BR13444]|uniref:alpha/beta fold hydrolase n=1 Tax=Paraburkholderia sp. BR13444 TaxID=3236997 RepID=UPI0034CF3714
MADTFRGDGGIKPLQPTFVCGHGPTHVIVAHGWMGDSHLFDPLLPFIDAERFTYAFIDCRGYGSRVGESGPKTIEAAADDVLCVAAQLGWERFHVVGHSMGGMVAQRLMVDVPDRLQSVALIAPVPACGATLDDARRALLSKAIRETAARRELIDLNTGGLRDNAWLDDLLSASVSSTSEAGLLGYLESWAGTNFQSEAEGSKVPTLVVVGDVDPGCSEGRMKDTALRWYPQSTLVLLPQTGHYPMRECPQELSRVLSDFFVMQTA